MPYDNAMTYPDALKYVGRWIDGHLTNRKRLVLAVGLLFEQANKDFCHTHGFIRSACADCRNVAVAWAESRREDECPYLYDGDKCPLGDKCPSLETEHARVS